MTAPSGVARSSAGASKSGFERVAHLRPAALPGGDAAAQYPVQAASGFLAQIDHLPDLTRPPFHFGPRYQNAMQLIQHGVRTFPRPPWEGSSMRPLLCSASCSESTFEGQAAIWLEQQARGASNQDAYPFPIDGRELDFRPLLEAVVWDRLHGRAEREIARAFQRGIATGLSHGRRCNSARTGQWIRWCSPEVSSRTSYCSRTFNRCFLPHGLEIWTNHAVPPNDGGISLGQAALAAFGQFNDMSPMCVRGAPLCMSFR